MIIEFKESFLKDIKKIEDKNIKTKLKIIINKCEKSKSLSEIKNIKKLKGYENFYRIRIRDYRIGIKANNEKIVFVRILHRKDIYKKFP